jgi:hypothetical protein
MKERWLYPLTVSDFHSLEAFNTSYADYVREYNTTYHTGIKEAPLERYLRTMDNAIVPKSREWLDQCFLNRIGRKVRSDSTIPIDKVFYDAPQQFIGMNVEVRYLPDRMNDAYILYEKEKYPLKPTNKNANCYTKRDNVPSIDYSKAGKNK